MTVSESQGWRRCPFIVGESYRTRKAFRAFREYFASGEVLKFERAAYSRYENMTGYFFRDSTGQIRAWDLPDEAHEALHEELFEHVTA